MITNATPRVIDETRTGTLNNLQRKIRKIKLNKHNKHMQKVDKYY